ncbi:MULTISPECIES: toll/interleukin-1 receptor domain-containing protein [Niastella]|uniref:Toll/interleukin-1 receptor domain-containing protein n=1 Tax=Niastella soli TaxID=2821487 RepID=A0ABS3YT96_9BACT|nr:toll/interleukin-1 receptor domain-containing protein [Niastella soli]MBO9201028.1 toll/interleukin-1 receptor domain-containing protein [Niastella soli]
MMILNRQKVFISYSTHDTPYAKAICTWLEENSIPCWMAPRDIIPGTSYGEAIIRAIRQAKIMVLVFTAYANESKYVNKEVERAVSNGTIIIPVRFQNVSLCQALDFFLSAEQWLDALNPPLKKHLDKLVESVKVLQVSSQLQHAPKKESYKEARKDIRMFEELAPDNWYGQSRYSLFRWIRNQFKDNS